MSNHQKRNEYQLIVIGAGSGGLVAAETAASLGAKVAIIEKNKIGGECLNSGCVPSKALIYAARSFYQASHSPFIVNKPELNSAGINRHLQNAINQIEHDHDNAQYLSSKGIDVIFGEAKFIGDKQIEINGRAINARSFIISTGSRPLIPDIKGLESVPYLTNESIFDLSELPESLTVIGGGPIGCELSQAYAMLGCRTVLIQSAAQLLPREEKEVSSQVLQGLSASGVEVFLNSEIESVSNNPDITISLKGNRQINSHQLLIATGRKAVLPEGLDRVGVKVNTRGIAVNKHLESSQSGIFAIGDCCGGPQFTHLAAKEASVAVRNALFPTRSSIDILNTPRATFTTPEVAHFGIEKSTLKNLDYVIRLDYREIDRAVSDDSQGFIEIYTQDNKIVGATIVGHQASELIQSVAAAKTISDLYSFIRPYPTYGSGLAQMAANFNLNKLSKSTKGRIYIANILPFANLTNKRSAEAHRGWKRFLAINLLSGFVITMILIAVFRHYSVGL